MSTPVRYFDAFAALRGVYLEDSYVLGIAQSAVAVEFELDAVLTPEHPRHRPPRAGEQHCYQRGLLRLRSAGGLRLLLSGAPPAVDAAGEADLGNIDTMEPVGVDGTWQLRGDWGGLDVVDPEVTFTLSA